jgi:hypothetical protein
MAVEEGFAFVIMLRADIPSRGGKGEEELETGNCEIQRRLNVGPVMYSRLVQDGDNRNSVTSRCLTQSSTNLISTFLNPTSATDNSKLEWETKCLIHNR